MTVISTSRTYFAAEILSSFDAYLLVLLYETHSTEQCQPPASDRVRKVSKKKY